MADQVRDSAPVATIPEPRLNIGITGHRLDRLDDAAPGYIAEALASLFAAIELAARGARICLVNSLADGADSIAAETALARGWTVDAILPFSRGDYAADFAPGDSAGQFARLLAASRSVLELDGSRGGLHGDSIAYERAGRVLLAQSDVLVAVWDGGPVRGRGGAAQIVTEAVQLAIPVIQIDPTRAQPPVLLWDGLEELALGLDTVDSVARGSLDQLPDLVHALVDLPQDGHLAALVQSDHASGRPRRNWTFVYPLLLWAVGGRRLRVRGSATGDGMARSLAAIAPLCAEDKSLGGRLQRLLAPRFARADVTATENARLFRHSFVANYAMAAGAVLVSLLGLTVSSTIKPALIIVEIMLIASILLRTRRGNRAGWHQAWLDTRALAERLRCLAISARLGDLNLRGASQPGLGIHQRDWAAQYGVATAREVGLPTVVIDRAYLAGLQDVMLNLVDGELNYLAGEAHLMHRVEHRLHRLGTWLFALTALSCTALLIFKLVQATQPALDGSAHAITLAASIVGAALPAFGAAIYGVRMQGDFAGSARRNSDLAEKLRFLRQAIEAGEPDFDKLSRCARGVTSLLTADVASWHRNTGARPLTLPG